MAHSRRLRLTTERLGELTPAELGSVGAGTVNPTVLTDPVICGTVTTNITICGVVGRLTTAITP